MAHLLVVDEWTDEIADIKDLVHDVLGECGIESSVEDLTEWEMLLRLLPGYASLFAVAEAEDAPALVEFIDELGDIYNRACQLRAKHFAAKGEQDGRS